MIGLAEYTAELVDDYVTDISSIGNKYGDIYEHQLGCAIDSPLNKEKNLNIQIQMIRGEVKPKL